MNIKSIRTFIGSNKFEVSRDFYLTLGFIEIQLSKKMSYFHIENYGFYLQDYYVKDWNDNSMVFLEVNNLQKHFTDIQKLNLSTKFKNVKISNIVTKDWGGEFFLHDPSGVLWHIGEFSNTSV